jgi:hypothetical protein
MIVAAAACSDQQITGNRPPAAPPAVNPNNTAGMLRGTVREDGTVLLESLDPSIQVGDDASGAIYGNQNVTAKVTTSQFAVNNTANNTKTWTFKLAVHNLLNYPVGTIDGVSSTPYDTVGMYVFFPNAPTVVSPNPCSGCAITIVNPSGAANFTAPNQQYYWYHDRLSAKGLAGDSTKNNPTWTFTAKNTVTSFRFFVVLSSPWARGMQTQDTTWSVLYLPGNDSLPDVNAKPRWKTVGVSDAATATLSSGTLKMDANHSGGGGIFCVLFGSCSDDRFYYRSDNLDRNEKAYAEARLSLTSNSTNPVAIVALADSVKFVGLGIGNGKIGFVTFNTSTLQWQWLGGPTLSVNTTGTHTYRIGKFGATNATIYYDGVEKVSADNTVLPNNFMPGFSSNVGAQAAHLSTFFGITAQDADANATISYATYAFGATPKP